MNENKNFKVFVDFDGTITRRDVGEAMFLEFGDADSANRIIQDWIDKNINAVQCWQQLCSSIKSLNITAFDKFINEIEIDEGFVKFVDYCQSNGIEITVLSDGLDYYIKRILDKEKLNHLRVFSNQLLIDDNNNLVPLFPFTDEECDRCANCKRNHVLNLSSEEDYSVYIGDGWSDTCPSQYCDFIFAKNSLLKYCEKNRISFFPYTNFFDVIKRFEELRLKKRLKKRHQALLKRNEIFVQG